MAPYYAPSSGGTAKRIITYNTMFENAARFTTFTGNAATAGYDTNGITLGRGTTATGKTCVFDPNQAPGVATGTYDMNPSLWFDAEMNNTGGAGNSWVVYVTFGNTSSSNASVPNPLTSYFGFKVVYANGVGACYAVTSDGVSETATSVSNGVWGNGNACSFMAKMASGSKCDFFSNKILVATLTTNLPTGFTNGRWSAVLVGSVGTSNTQWLMRSLGYSYDAEA
jgi:hypothetical protein